MIAARFEISFDMLTACEFNMHNAMYSASLTRTLCDIGAS